MACRPEYASTTSRPLREAGSCGAAVAMSSRSAGEGCPTRSVKQTFVAAPWTGSARRSSATMTTIVLPAFSGRLATSSAAQTVAPDEMPPRMPSSAPRRRAVATAWSMFDVDDLVVDARGRGSSGTKFAPMPWILCGPGAPPLRMGDSAGSTPTICTLGLALLEHLADAGDRAAGADAGHEDVDGAVGVVPDLLGRWCARWISGFAGVLELLGEDGARGLGDDLLGACDRALHALGARGEHELGAVGAQQRATLLASWSRAS